MKRILCLLLLCSTVSFSQTITVDNTTNSPTDLVNLLVANSCVEVSNISISSNQSVGYFNQNGSSFPLNQGVILRSGNVMDTQGPYTGANMGSTTAGGGTDAFLQNLSNTSSGTTAPLTDLSFLQFDFTTIASSFNFDFLFASNDYGQFQCLSNDIFAIELTDLNTGVTTNVAVIPTTSNPISIKFIKDALYNNTCSSTNPELFSTYNVSSPGTSTLNMRGHTVVLNASATIIPNNPYRIKMVVADYINFNYDSAVFITQGSFTNSVDLGPDQIICAGNSTTLDAQLDNTYTYQWFQDGNPVGTNSSTFTVNGPGTYTVEVTKGSCFITDTIVFNDLPVSAPINLQTCNTGASSYTFDLTTNDETQLGIDTSIYNVIYYASPADVASNTPIASPNSFPTTAGQTIYVKIFNTVTNEFCNALYQFDLLINATVNATQPSDVELCETSGSTFYFLANLDPDVLSGQSGYNVLYYTSQADAIAGNGAIITSVDIPNGTTSVTVWIRMQDSTNPGCFDVTSVDIIVNPLPLVDTIPQVLECSNFVLPVITNGTYYTGPNGTGTQLNPGDTIDESNTYYIYNGPDANGCYNQSTFTAYFVDEYEPTLDNCGFFVVPTPEYNIGAFYTAAGGPTGTGTLIPTGTVYTNNTSSSIVQTIFYYAEVNNVFCTDKQFDINIHPIPLADDPADVTFCNSYTLPALTNGNYFSGPGGTGTPYFAGDNITTSQLMYVYNNNTFTDVNGNPGVCGLENTFQINIVDTTVFTTISTCASYTLPPIAFGGYFTNPMGGGTPIDPTIPITTSQVVYYYTNTTLLPNCTDNLNYNITIHPLPAVDTLPSGTFCGEFILPVLSNGTYYTLPGGSSTPGQVTLSAGQIIDLTGDNLNPGTYYIYAGPSANGCVQESSFTISITPFPGLEQFINTIECSPYTIATPPVGQIYTQPDGPNGTGVVVNSTTVYTSTQTFYLYFVDPVTGCKIDKKFTKIFKGINLPVLTDIMACDSFTLDTLNPDPLDHVAPEPESGYTIAYHLDTPTGPTIASNFVFDITNALTPRTVWLVAVNTDGYLINCSESRSFTITVSATPNISLLNLPVLAPTFDNEVCGEMNLPTLPTSASIGYNIGYFTDPNGVGPITNLNIVNNTGAPSNPAATSLNFPYYVYAVATNNPNCHDERAFNFTVHPLLDLPLQGGIICVDPITNTAIDTYTIQTGLNPADYTVNWYLNGTLMGTGPNYTASEAGIYDVEFIKLTPDVGTDCNYRDTTVEIVASSPAIADFVVSQEFDTVNTFITVNITGGFGNYIYQLEYPDGTTSAFQTSNTFTNLEAGEYFVNIYDTLGNCAPSQVGPIFVVNYPNFFTPNGDGTNDRWNIFHLAYQNDAVISIFDRYGKFIKQISPTGLGWDGKYNGKDLPSTDYWFTVEYTTQNNQKAIFKSHFALKR